jgi:hypothetical protein
LFIFYFILFIKFFFYFIHFNFLLFCLFLFLAELGLSDEQLMLYETAKKFSKEIEPLAPEWDAKQIFPGNFFQ